MADVSRAADRDDELGEGTKAWSFTSPVRLDQLDHEVTEAMNWRNQAGLSASGSAEEANPEEPLIVWVGRDDIDVGVFESTAAAHQPDSTWYPEKGTDEEGEATSTLDNVMAKAQSGAALTEPEVQLALRHLLTKD